MAATKEEKMEGGRRGSQAVTPPEGGWGWMIVAGCFFSTICIRAVTRCVSMFFVEFQLHFEKDYSSTAWIHSLIDCMTMLCAPLGGFLVSRFSCRFTVVLGGVLSSAGFVLSSFATRLEHLYISMGLLAGLGFALSYTPAIAMVGKYFNERKALAYGIALSGSGIGTFVLAPAVQMLIEHYSWRGALLVLGGFVSNLCVCGAVMRPLEPKKGGRLWENRMANLEKEGMTTVLDSKDSKEENGSNPSHVEPKQLEISNLNETESLLISNGALKNIDELGQGHITLLSNTSLSDPGLKELKIAECILFSNRLTETMLGGISDLSLTKESTDSEKLESMNLNNKAAGTNAKTEDSGISETKIIENFHLEDSVFLPPEPSSNKPTKTLSKLCHNSMEEFRFLTFPTFLIMSVSFLFLAYGCSAPVVYLIPYALSVGVEPKHAAFLMSIFGISGIVGNITFGWITDRKCLKRYRMLSYMLAIGMEGLCCLFVPLLHSFPLLVSFSVLYGYFDGAYVTLIPVVTSDVVGSTYLTPALGMVYFLHAIPYLVSPPIGGWLVDQTGSYAATFSLSGSSYLFSAVVLSAAILVKRSQSSRSNSALPLSPEDPAATTQQGVI